MKTEQAQKIVISLFQELAKDDELMSRFFALTGLDPSELRTTVESEDFFRAILDFICSHEPTLLMLAERANIKPEHISLAHFTLNPQSDF